MQKETQEKPIRERPAQKLPVQGKAVKKLAIALSAVGPGLFLIGYNIGTGSVTTMAKAGAEHGMSLFWTLVLSSFFTYILMVAYGQVTLVTGKTALRNFRENFQWGKVLAIYILIALILGELLALMGIMGIVGDLLQEASRLLFGESFSKAGIVLVLAVMLYVLLWYGRYGTFEKLLTVLVIVMGLCFVLVALMVKPSLSAITSGLVPRMPEGGRSLGLIAAMAGTTCSAAVFVMRSTVVAEKGWTILDLKGEKKDAFVSAFMMLFLSGVIMAVAAGTLHIMGMKLDNTVEMIHLFEPIGGRAAAFILILGVSGAGLSTVFPIVLIAPWLICDYTGRPRDIHSPLFRVLGFGGILFGLGTLFLAQRPPAIMIFSQAFQACILPAVAIPILILVNRSRLMREHTANRWMNVALVAVVIFSLITTGFAITELFFG